MTQIEVPDWVARIADDAAEEFAKTHTMSMYASLADMQLDCVRHMLTAALGAWVVPVGYQETTFHEQGAIYATSALWHWIPGKPIPESTADTFREPLYTLRQEKPE